MRYFIIAGEDSGDLHGSKLVEKLFVQDPEAEIYGMGGVLMESVGMKLWRNYHDLAVMGISEVLKKLWTFRKLIKECAVEIKNYNPDRIVFIDYGGFNLRVAKLTKEMGFYNSYYILPKVWAWNEKRVIKIAKYIDEAFVIFPFEESYFKARGVKAKYVGHPVKERIDEFLANNSDLKVQANTIALLPGSRKQEIDRVLPVLLEYAKKMGSQYSFKLALNKSAEHFVQHIDLPKNVEIVWGATYRVITESAMAIATSGTVTLETALIGTPQIVCYKASRLNYFLGKMFIKVKYLSPVNLILKDEVVPELIQNDLTPEALFEQTQSIMNNKGDIQKSAYENLNVTLRNAKASVTVAVLLSKPKIHT